MKAVIWICSILVCSAVITLLKYAGITLGALETLLIYVLFVSFPTKKLCDVWDKRKASKSDISIESASVEAPTSKDTTVVDEPMEEIATPSEQIDTPQIAPSSPPPNKAPLFVFFLVALCVSFIAIGYFCYSTGYKSGYGVGNESGYESGHKTGYDEGHNDGYTDAESTYSKSINELKIDKNELQSEVDDLQDTINFYELVLDNIEPEYWFYHNYAVIVTTTGSKYHQYGCSHIGDRDFYIFNIDNAKYQGYTPCLDCWDE